MRRIALIALVVLAGCDPAKKTAPTFSLDGKYVLQSIGGVSMPYQDLNLSGPGITDVDTITVDTLRLNPDSTWTEYIHHRETVNGKATSSTMRLLGFWSRTSDSTVTLATSASSQGNANYSGKWTPGVLTLKLGIASYVYYGGDH